MAEGQKNNIILPSRQKSSVAAKPPYCHLKCDFASNIAGLILFPVTHSWNKAFYAEKIILYIWLAALSSMTRVQRTTVRGQKSEGKKKKKTTVWKPWRENRFSAAGSPPISTNQFCNDHINSFYRGAPKGNVPVVPFQSAVQFTLIANINISANNICWDPSLCKSLKHRNSDLFCSVTLEALWPKWRFLKRLPPTEKKKAEPHTCTKYSGRGWFYLVVCCCWELAKWL